MCVAAWGQLLQKLHEEKGFIVEVGGNQQRYQQRAMSNASYLESTYSSGIIRYYYHLLHRVSNENSECNILVGP